MKKILVGIACLAVAIFSAIAIAYASGLLTKQPIYNEKTEKYELIEDYVGYIESRKIPFDETKAFDSVPVYYNGDILHDTGDCGFYLGRDAGFYSCLSPNTRKDFSKAIFAALPTDAIRETSDKSGVYAVYDTDIGVRMFLFFSQEKNDYMTLDGFPVIMQKKLEYKDFADIQIGDSIKKVESVDPIIPRYIEFFDTGSDDFIKGYVKIGAGPTSIHLLTDGILKIEYDRTEDDDYVIINIVYSDDFVLEGLDGKTCYKIAEIDYVK